ncbi:phage head-tail adapter protein [Streptomyces sp. NBC_01198]|uniref:phage head-tail adapter protein n=1 Tax=Streptomyces sp. NBC_01198 TaxID=2903769 RepID=UPI002E0DC3E0|nr:phage head-tail adapter protein [Streptomyces sp. NBC_01198]
MQRRRGLKAKVWKTAVTTDRRGNTVTAAIEDGPYEVKVAVIPQRSARAEVPGQQQINVIRILVDPNLPDVNLWSRVELLGSTWDVVTPPAYHHGSRRTRHWGLDLRERP